MTERLIAEHGFCAVVVEADWPDAYRVNRYVRNENDDHDAEEALNGFKRFPTWMWRNVESSTSSAGFATITIRARAAAGRILWSRPLFALLSIDR